MIVHLQDCVTEVFQRLQDLLGLLSEDSLSSIHGSVVSIEDHICDLMYQIGRFGVTFPSIVDTVKNVFD